MGTITFQLPADLPDGAPQALERASMLGGQDNMPYPTAITLNGRRFQVGRAADESGQLATPWDVPGAGQLMAHTATLIERADPYLLALELARGKINQVRNQSA